MNDRLTKALEQLKETVNTGAPPEIEAALKLEFDRVRRHARIRRWSIAAGAVAAAALALMLAPRPGPAESPTQPATVAAGAAASEQPFIPIPYVAPLGPYERGEVVRMALPVAALLSAGLRVETADPSGFAEADIIVGQDGSPRAVRLISIQGQ
jgi:hypothetical protein